MQSPATSELLQFGGKVVLVTGGSRGIGAGIARRFAEAGAEVALSYRTGEEEANAVLAEIVGQGGLAIALAADVTEREQVDALVEQTVARLGRLDVLVNNAGIYPLVGLTEMSEAEWDAVVDANLKSVFLCTQSVARVLRRQGRGGAIVNIASIEAERTAPLHSHYNAAKAGVLHHTRAAALELGPHGIRVNAVSPGLIWRQGIEEQWPDGVERWLARAPLGRLGLAEEVADACLFLASPAARFVTGVNLPVDGGVLAAPAF